MRITMALISLILVTSDLTAEPFHRYSGVQCVNTSGPSMYGPERSALGSTNEPGVLNVLSCPMDHFGEDEGLGRFAWVYLNDGSTTSSSRCRRTAVARNGTLFAGVWTSSSAQYSHSQTTSNPGYTGPSELRVNNIGGPLGTFIASSVLECSLSGPATLYGYAYDREL